MYITVSSEGGGQLISTKGIYKICLFNCGNDVKVGPSSERVCTFAIAVFYLAEIPVKNEKFKDNSS